MLIVSNRQVEQLNELIISNHKKEMKKFVQKYYTNHFQLLAENIDEYVNQVIKKAIEFNLSSEKNIYLLLNLSLLLGFNFNENRLYEWCSTFQLKNTPNNDLEEITKITLEKLHTVTGKDNIKIYRQIVVFKSDMEAIFKKLKTATDADSFILFTEEIFPSKFQIIDRNNLILIHGTSKEMGKKYNIFKNDNIAVLSFLQVCVGYNFDSDLLFKFMKNILISKMDEDQKCELLYKESISILEKFLNR